MFFLPLAYKMHIIKTEIDSVEFISRGSMSNDQHPDDAQHIVKNIANMKTLDLAHALNPDIVSDDFRNKVLDDQAARSVLLRQGGTDTTNPNKAAVADLSRSTQDITTLIANGLSGDQYKTPEDRQKAAASMVEAERKAMDKDDYKPPTLTKADKKPEFVVPRIGDIAQKLVPENQKVSLQNILDQTWRLQADARAFYKLNWPQDQDHTKWPEARAGKKDPSAVTAAQERYNQVLQAHDAAEKAGDQPIPDARKLRDDTRKDVADLLKEPDMAANSDAAELGRMIGAVPLPSSARSTPRNRLRVDAQAHHVTGTRSQSKAAAPATVRKIVKHSL